MNHYRTKKLNAEQFQPLHGEKVEVEMPKDSIIDLWVEWYSSVPLTVYLKYATGIDVPYAVSAHGFFSLRTVNLLSVLFVKPKAADGVACVQYKDLAVKEKADWTPVEIAPPPPLSVQLSSLIDQQVQSQLEKMGVLKETIDISEEDNLEEDVELDEFGGGYMEDEEPIRKPKKTKNQEGKPAAPRASDPPGDVNPGSNPASAPGEKSS